MEECLGSHDELLTKAVLENRCSQILMPNLRMLKQAQPLLGLESERACSQQDRTGKWLARITGFFLSLPCSTYRTEVS